MYLSYLHVNTRENADYRSPGREWLRNQYRVHQRLCMAFPSKERTTSDPHYIHPFSPEGFNRDVHSVERTGDNGFLFRVDFLNQGKIAILVQSAFEPDWEYAFHNAPHLLTTWEEPKPFAPLLHTGELCRFRLRANPIKASWEKREMNKDGKPRGKRQPLKTPVERRKWLERQFNLSGAEIVRVTESDEGLRHFYKGRGEAIRTIHLHSVLFNGTLRVVDPQSLVQAIQTGIGPGKAIGFGLLSLARVRHEESPGTSPV